jgi:hypothetical protein
MKLNTDIKVTFNPKSKVHEINTVTESAASQAHKLYYIDLFRDAAKIIFYIDRKKSPTFISFVR